jgi:hypothetical protein
VPGPWRATRCRGSTAAATTKLLTGKRSLHEPFHQPARIGGQTLTSTCDQHIGTEPEPRSTTGGAAPRTVAATPAAARPAPQAGPRHGPSRAAPARTGPPGRRDSRRPATRGGPRTTAARPPVHRWFADQLMLVLSGRRPVHALLGHVRSPAYEQLITLAAHRPLLPRGADRRVAVLASVYGQRSRADVIEAYARVTVGGRDRALAFRLEACVDRRWRCAAVELG